MLTADQVASYERDGYLVLPRLVPVADCRALIDRAAELVRDGAPQGARSIFTTKEQDRVSDDYFLTSGDQIRFFFEPDGVTLNKIGHALHDLDPVFSAFSRRPELAGIVAALGMRDPLLLQSMYLVKAARTGGEVDSHQDAAFLYTEPQSCVGLWFALEDATVDNGCLWALPGGHRAVPLGRRFARAPEGGTRFVRLGEDPEVPSDGWVPLEAPAGTLVVLHWLLPHRSSPNTSPRSRNAYSLHLVDATAHYPPDNWLQRRPGFPARGF